MRNILLIGDDAIAPYARALEADGFQTTVRSPGDDDDSGDFDAIVLDLSSLAEDAASKRILEAAHAGEAPAVIAFISANQLAAFDPANALDDFLLSGASPDELCARVRQALWKRHGVDARNILKCGDLEMDLANYTVHISGKPVGLTYKEYELLRFLATNRDRVYNRETLLNKVWGYDFYGGARTVDVHIRRLRSKIEEHHRPFIETVRNVGYRFKAGS
jgi:DNA-binding response OmpR family regulator